MRHQCIVCGHRLPQKALFILDNAPASAQNIPSAEEVKDDKGVTLGLYQCPECELVQFDCEPVDYYRDVIRAGGFSTTMTGLRRSQYAHMIETFHLEGKRFIEVGCGRGEFLKVLTEFPVNAYGIEHKADLVEIAKQDGLKVWRQFPDTAEEIFACPDADSEIHAEIHTEIHTESDSVRMGENCSEKDADAMRGQYDVFLSFNFLEHQPHPSVMLQAIYHNLTDEGMGLVTVPALEYIVEKGSYYELIHDHIAYYSFDALRQLLRRNGFEVLEEEMVNRDTISMIVKKIPGMHFGNDRNTADNRNDRTHEYSDAGNDTGSQMVQSLVRGHEKVQREIAALIERFQVSGRTLAVWGASHQGFTLMSTTPIGSCARYIIDSAPFKQGRFAPASHLPIVAPDHFHQEPVDAVLIVAPGYTDEIAASIRDKFGPQVEILTMRTDRVETYVC